MELPHVSSALGVVHPMMLAHGTNAEVWDEQDQRYIDFVAGIGVLNVGHRHPAVIKAVKAQADALMHSAFNAVPHRPYLKVCQALADFLPLPYPVKCMLTNSGAEATENALKIARTATGRQAVIAFDEGFHGRTLAALNLNGKVKPYKNGLGVLPGPVHHVPFPSPDNDIDADTAMAALDRTVRVEVPADEVAAIIIEPVQGEAGFRALEPKFAARLPEWCKQHGILLIADEIQCGFGRTGSPMAFSAFDLTPDLVLIGKSIAGGLPLAAVAGRAEIIDSPPPGGLGGTYSGNPMACAAALAVMQTMTPETLTQWRSNLQPRLETAYRRWCDLGCFHMLGELTGMGCMRGVVFEDTPHASGRVHLTRLIEAARQRGLLLMPSGRDRNVLRLLPPLTIEPDVLDEGLALLEQAIHDVAALNTSTQSEICQTATQ